MAQAQHIQLRKKINSFLQKSFKTLMLKAPTNEPIELDNIQRILLVRVNYRIGNIIFNTPIINALSQIFPHAKIDMMIGAPFITPLMQEMPNIHTVYSFDRSLLKHPLKMYTLRKQMNQNAYDLMIFPSGLSSSDALMSWMIDATYKLGFSHERSSKKLTHTVEYLPQYTHEALKPLALLQVFGNKDLSVFPHILDLKITAQEKSHVKKEIHAHSIGIFRDARRDKKIDNAWWKTFISTLQQKDATLHFVDILDPNNTEPLHPHMVSLSEKNLRILASKISHLDAFICADTGPMHLASATLTPTIALFKTTSPDLYGTLGTNDYSLVIQDKDIEEIASEIIQHLKHIGK